MRLLLWVLLVTLVTLFASTNAASSKIINADTTGSIEAPATTARALSPADGNRRLRSWDNDDAKDDDEEDVDDESEERAFSISNTFNGMKTAVGKRSKSMGDAVIKRLDKYIDSKAMELYKTGATPIGLQATQMGSVVNKKALVFYKQWYDKNVAAGVIKALD